jgi:phage terminase large subunit-like protein
MWAITTAGYNIEGPCYDKRREVIEMLNGTVPNDELFGVIYTVDEGMTGLIRRFFTKPIPIWGYRFILISF